jgi:hypothetical protein
MQTIT